MQKSLFSHSVQSNWLPSFFSVKHTAQRPRPTGGRQGGTGHWTDGKGTAMDYDQEVTINIGDEQPAESTSHKEVT